MSSPLRRTGEAGGPDPSEVSQQIAALADRGASQDEVLNRAAMMLGVSPTDLLCVVQAVDRSGSGARQSDLGVLVLDDVPDAERLLAVRRLGFNADSHLTLVVCHGPDRQAENLIEQLRTQDPRSQYGFVDRLYLLVSAQPLDMTELTIPAGLRVAYVAGRPASAAREAWLHVRNALRFALPARHDEDAPSLDSAVMINADDVGAYLVLAEQLTPESMSRIPDVQRLDHLLNQAPPDILDTLLAVSATDSLRMAARATHMHHNSVAHRVERAQSVLGFALTEPYGRARLLLVLTLHRLIRSHSLF